MTKFATNVDYSHIKSLLTDYSMGGKKGRIPNIRVKNFDIDLKHHGYNELFDITDEQKNCSGIYMIRSFEKDDLIFTIVLQGIKSNGISCIVKKQLSPTNLELSNKIFSKKELVEAVIDKLHLINDDIYKRVLINLVRYTNDNLNNVSISNEINSIKSNLKVISQDFGEILSAIALSDKNSKISFPNGNAKLYDVNIDDIYYSVKSLSGSGTSMDSFRQQVLDYETTITDRKRLLLFQNNIKIWLKSPGQSVVNNIIDAAKINKTPEYLQYCKILGNFNNDMELRNNLSMLNVQNISFNSFIEMIYPAMICGNWGYPIGLPKNGLRYSNSPINEGANIIVYSLGQSILKQINNGPDSVVINEMLNDMVRKMSYRCAHVSITNDGQVIVKNTAFSEISCKFDYHAPSHIPGNNRPGIKFIC